MNKKLINKNAKWLREGAQTQFNPHIKKLAKRLRGRNDYETVFNILHWIKKNIKFVKSWQWREKHLCKRTAEEVALSKRGSGCGDKGIVFVALARANNIPAKYVLALDRDWLKAKKPGFVSEHVFSDILIGDKWRIVDPTIATLNLDYVGPMSKKYIVSRKSLDSWSMNRRNYQDTKKMAISFRKKGV